MNHDATHCLDYDPKRCPPECYRAKLAEDLRAEYCPYPLSYAHFIHLEDCYKHWQSYFKKDGAR